MIFSSLSDYDGKTLILYIAIIAMASIMAVFSQTCIKVAKMRNGDVVLERKFRSFPYFCSFAILAFFACTTSVGIDRTTYGINFTEANAGDIFNRREIGYNIFMLIVGLFTDDPAIFCGVFAFVFVALVYYGLYTLRNDLSLGIAIFIFASQYYLQSYNLMRIYFAMGVLISGIVLVKKKKYFRYFIVMLIAFSFHYSVIIAIGAYLLGMIYIKCRGLSLGMHALWTCGALVFAFIFMIIGGKAMAQIDLPLFERYAGYLSNISLSSLGFLWIVQCAPAIAALYAFRTINDDSGFRYFGLSYFFVYMLVSVLSYSVPVIGRALIVLSFTNMIFLPYVLEKIRRNTIVRENSCNSRVIATAMGEKIVLSTSRACYGCVLGITVIYFLFMLLLYMDGYVSADGIDKFSFIWENYLW